ncbi:MAG: pyruvate kinase [Desulfobacterales bacterium]|jgi:pyruvate kinase
MPIKINTKRSSKRTKIVATLGPASDSRDTLQKMILAGLDVVRINFSHGSHDYLDPLIKRVRKLNEEMEVPIPIIGDLRGPRIRVGEIESHTVEVKTDQKICLTPQKTAGNHEFVSVSYPDMARDVQIGSRILLDDGNIELEVEKIEINGDVWCRVHQGGQLSSHRGINLPGLRVSLASITRKDFVDIDFAITQQIDFLALSFVQCANDVRRLKEYLAQKGADIPVIAKIERQNALDDIEEIVGVADGVMVARGDLALEMSLQDVPIAQKRIINICRHAAIPVITATQMLESMIDMRKPTRAEATDVTNAILDGTDALMLSAETSIGRYPVETVSTMSTLAVATEKAWFEGKLSGALPFTPPQEIEPTVAYAGNLVANTLSAKVIVAYTASGMTARRLVCHRPQRSVLALTASPKIQRRLALTWGVESARVKIIKETDDIVHVAFSEVQRYGLADKGDTIVIIAGTPPHGQSGRTNTLKVERIP